ncbi:hypothetical protein [Pseudomonas sp. FP2338]|uniref:hypothetical protein n=1 Tax=Pseudomonas sp. FP2338 TaxID=2954093 RepID=UPI00273518B4|nr:hypothetical protein [Pseudomonas sp. FP2338]WLH85991.1 hypothetical protein PSH96_05970 [Pseudomonas sp. FP2338]
MTFGKWFAIAAIVALIAFLWNLANEQDRRWQEFAQAHNCKRVESQPGIYTPRLVGWSCNNGMTYWR